MKERWKYLEEVETDFVGGDEGVGGKDAKRRKSIKNGQKSAGFENFPVFNSVNRKKHNIFQKSTQKN